MSAGFAPLVRAELTKLVTVRRWLAGLGAMALLTVGFGLLAAAGTRNDVNEHPFFVVGPAGTAVVDELTFVHGTVSGDATVTARVTAQDPSHPDAQAGLMLKQDTTSGSRYASVAFTPDNGVRFDHDFTTDPVSAAGSAPGWLRLQRDGSRVRGYVSDDGQDWRLVGTSDLGDLGPDLEVGLFVSSPPDVRVERLAGGTAVGESVTVGEATFDDVTLDGTGTVDGWRGEDISRPGPAPGKPGQPQAPAGEAERSGGTWTVTGSGRIGPAEGPDDSVQISLFGTLFGLMALATVAVLFATSEYKRRLVWTTFAASPRRRPVLAAKAVVLAATTFVLGLVTTVAAYFLVRPVIRANGFSLPAYEPTSIGQPGVLRAIVGNAVLLTAFALVGLALGMILRRSATAIATVFVLGVVPLFAASVVPAASRWLMWLTPAGGFAIERAKPPTDELAEPWSQISPWVGLGVACAYAVATLGVAAWLLERRDA